MSTKGKNIRQRSSGDFDDGNYLSHMPTATGEQLNIAKILEKPGNDREIKHYVSQLRELTQCTEDDAVTALYDCENNLERAVGLLLDKCRCGDDNEWQTSVGKRTKTKVRLNTDSTSDETATSFPPKEVDGTLNELDVIQPEKHAIVPSSTENKAKRDRKPKRSFPNRPTRGGEVTELNSYKTSRGVVPKSDRIEIGERIKKERTCNDVDGWDPYTEYGEWTGELIEVINSDVSIAKGLEDCLVLHSDILAESDGGSTRLTSESETKIDQHDHEPSTLGYSSDDSTDLFIRKARSKRPPSAFTNRPNVDLYFATDVLPNIKSKLRYVFGGDWAAQVLLTSGRTNEITSLRAQPATDPSERSAFNSSRSFSTNILKTKAKTGSMDSSTAHAEKTKNIQSSFTDNVSTNLASIKNAPPFQGTLKSASTSALISESNAHPSPLIEPSYKDYMLDGISNSVTKMSVEQVVSSSDSYVQRPSKSDSQNAGPSYISHQNAVAAPMPTQKNTVSHGSVNAQTTTASQTQQSTTIPHPVPHFVGQFAPSPYMFNMSGGSGNPATLYDLEQLQLLQQHRMLYDMQFQPQAATTVQSVLPPSETSTVKNSVQGLPAPFAHVTAANATVRPDIITSAVGHATQLMQPGHPYFHYPRFVLMNGYQNTYLNQQQSGQEGSTSGNANSQLSNAAVIHGALPVTQSDGQSQAYNNMKMTHAYNDLSDLKYGDLSKQVGFKSGSGQQHQQPYFPFNGQGGTEAPKPMPPTTLNQAAVSGAASTAGYPTPGNAVHYSQQQQSQQFYPPMGASPYFTAAAVAAAAVAAASAQQQQQQHVIGGAGSQPSVSSGSSTGPSQMTHMHPQTGAPAMVYPGAGLHVHHSGQQRSAIPH